MTALFLFWGIRSSMKDILIKQFMKSFEITRFRASPIQSSFYVGYFLLAMPAASVKRKYSYKTRLVIGLLLYSLGTFHFWPAPSTGITDSSRCLVRHREWGLVSGNSVAVGTGVTAGGLSQFGGE